MAAATATVYGTNVTGNQRQDWLNAKYILMWGWNPAEMRDGTNTEFFLRRAREKGARIVCIDPRMTLSAVALADEWMPIRPGTDAAMMSAMAHVMITRGPRRRGVRRTHCVGFDGTQMPRGGRDGRELQGLHPRHARRHAEDPGVGRSASPASPRDDISRIAREYATLKPGVLYQGYGMQRRAFGEQVVRAGCVLRGNHRERRRPGRMGRGHGLQAPAGGPLWNVFPAGANPVKASIPTFLWTEAVLRGTALGPEHGVRGAPKLDEQHQADLRGGLEHR